jgi:hypothetical protein
MKIAAYLLAILGGNTSPTADDVKSILESGISAMLVVNAVGLDSSILQLILRFSLCCMR